MRTRSLVLSLGLLAALPGFGLAQGPVNESLAGLHGLTAQILTASAEMVSEEIYEFSPTDEVRTFGQILGHVADSNYAICSTAAGEDNPMSESVEETKTTKAGLVAALAEAFAYCQGVYEGMTAAKGAEMAPFFGQDMARSAILAFNSAHNYEHYGNLVTYMRINGITPPTSM